MKFSIVAMLLLLSACTVTRTQYVDPIALAKSESAKFQRSQSPEACGSEARGCPDLVRATARILGTFVSATPSPVTSSFNYIVAKKVTVSFASKFTGGSANESFTWKIKDDLATLDSYEIKIDFAELAVNQWQTFRQHLASGSSGEACTMTWMEECPRRLAQASELLGIPEISKELFAGEVSMSREKPFPARVTLRTRSRFAKGGATETFEWGITPEGGFRVVGFEIAPTR